MVRSRKNLFQFGLSLDREWGPWGSLDREWRDADHLDSGSGQVDHQS